MQFLLMLPITGALASPQHCLSTLKSLATIPLPQCQPFSFTLNARVVLSNFHDPTFTTLDRQFPVVRPICRRFGRIVELQLLNAKFKTTNLKQGWPPSATLKHIFGTLQCFMMVITRNYLLMQFFKYIYTKNLCRNLNSYLHLIIYCLFIGYLFIGRSYKPIEGNTS